MRKKIDFDYPRFLHSLLLKNIKREFCGEPATSIEIVIVSTSKDFQVLPFCVEHAIKSVVDFSLVKVHVIVPPQDIDECQSVLKNFGEIVQIDNENDYIHSESRQRILKIFATRSNWVLQQILKVSAVIESKSDAVLILDSDTLLLGTRTWINQKDQQILMPSFEYNKPYYEFLNGLGLSHVDPEFTFVAHHMLMQPRFLRQALDAVNLSTIEKLLDYAIDNFDSGSNSPFCIEYELYAQYLVSAHPDKYFLHPWGNIGIPRIEFNSFIQSRFKMYFLSRLYNSVSFHSWS